MSRTVTHSSEESCAVCWFRRSHSSSSRNIRRSAHRAVASSVSPPVAASAASLRGSSNVVTWWCATDGDGASSCQFLNSSLNISTGNESISRRKPSHRDEADLLRAPSCRTADFMALPKPPAVCSARCADRARAPLYLGRERPHCTRDARCVKGWGRSRPILLLAAYRAVLYVRFISLGLRELCLTPR